MARIWMILAACGVVGGSCFLVVGVQYALSYYLEPNNPIRHEYLQGTAIALLIALPFWLIASAAILPVRGMMRRWMPAAIYSVTAGLALLFILANVLPVVLMAAS